jgi:hypothetical protein
MIQQQKRTQTRKNYVDKQLGNLLKKLKYFKKTKRSIITSVETNKEEENNFINYTKEKNFTDTSAGIKIYSDIKQITVKKN